jgi:hypothetical protein
MPANRVVDEHLLSPVLVYSGSGGVFENELVLNVEDGLVKEVIGDKLVIRGYKFEEDLTVSLGGGRSFGRYASGETIPAIGKTPAEIIQMAIAEPIDPTVSLSTPTTIGFNQTSISNVLNFSHIINTLGGAVSTATLQWRRGNTGSYEVLSNSLDSTGSFTHTLTDTTFNTASFSYQYVVTDSAGATSTASLTITPSAYIAPSISFSLASQAASSPETNIKREKGNVATVITGTITRNTSRVNLASYSIQRQINGSGSWVDVATNVSIGPGTTAITQITHNDSSLETSNSISYRVVVVDDYISTTSSSQTVSFLNLIFYGPASSVPSDSSSVRSLGTRVFTDASNPFTLSTGSTERNFSVALPPGKTITQVIDLDALNANITSNYVSGTISVEDGGGNGTNYNVYTMTNAIPYDSNHRHQVTRS